jgi:hypothetical protein
MEYDDFIKNVTSPSDAPPLKSRKNRTAESIMAELMPLVEADKRKGG